MPKYGLGSSKCGHPFLKIVVLIFIFVFTKQSLLLIFFLKSQEMAFILHIITAAYIYTDVEMIILNEGE